MPTKFANTLDNHPIYADRAEKDAAGNTISTTYQEKLTAGTGISIDSSNVISATGGGGGTTYTAGDNINIDQNDEISVVVSPSTTGDLVALDCEGHLVDSGIDPSDLQPALTAGANITIDANNVISATGGGSGTVYTAGNGISISGTTISAKVASPLMIDNSQNITLDGSVVPSGGTDGQVLTKVSGNPAWANVPGGGGGGSGWVKTVLSYPWTFYDANNPTAPVLTVGGLNFYLVQELQYNSSSSSRPYHWKHKLFISSSTVTQSFVTYVGDYYKAGQNPSSSAYVSENKWITTAVSSSDPQLFTVSSTPSELLVIEDSRHDTSTMTASEWLSYTDPATGTLKFYYTNNGVKQFLELNLFYRMGDVVYLNYQLS